MNDAISALAGGKFFGAFFTSDDKLVVTALYDSMNNLQTGTATNKRLMGQWKEHFAGAPTLLSGNVDWYYKGLAKLSGSVASRVTIVPIKPGSQKALLDTANSDGMKAGLKDAAFAQLIDVALFFDGDKCVVVSRYTSLKALMDSEDKQKELMAALGPYITGAPDRLFGTLAWSSPQIGAAQKQKSWCC